MTPSLDILLNLSGGIGDLRGIENGVTAKYSGELGVGSAFIRGVGFDLSPVGVVASRERLPDTRYPVT
jgi:hypothetical protein